MTMLPNEFSDLEPFAARWSLPTEKERYAERLSSSMDDMQAFYDATFPRAEAAKVYLDTFPLYSLISVSFAVEVWKQPNVPDSGAAYLDLVGEPTP